MTPNPDPSARARPDTSGTAARPGSRGSTSPADETGDSPRPRVILVREWEQQLSSSGCCGRIEGDFLDAGDGDGSAFPGRRHEMECAGDLYRALRERYGDRVDVRIVDPRNLLSLVPLVVQDARRHGASLREILRSLVRLSVNTVVVNGRVVARGRWPEPDEIVRILDDVPAADAASPASPTAPSDES